MSVSQERFYVDRRAKQVASNLPQNAEDKLLSTVEVAELLGCSRVWLDIRRTRGGGPKFLKLSYRRVRYRLSDLRGWLEERAHLRTNEYRK